MLRCQLPESAVFISQQQQFKLVSFFRQLRCRQYHALRIFLVIEIGSMNKTKNARWHRLIFKMRRIDYIRNSFISNGHKMPVYQIAQVAGNRKEKGGALQYFLI